MSEPANSILAYQPRYPLSPIDERPYEMLHPYMEKQGAPFQSARSPMYQALRQPRFLSRTPMATAATSYPALRMIDMTTHQLLQLE